MKQIAAADISSGHPSSGRHSEWLASCSPHCPLETQAPSIVWLSHPIGLVKGSLQPTEGDGALAWSEKSYFYFAEIPNDFQLAFPAPLILLSSHSSRPQPSPGPSAPPGMACSGIRAGQVGRAAVQATKQWKAGWTELVRVRSSSILQGAGGGGFSPPNPQSCGRRDRKRQLASSQLESAHAESQFLLSEFQCAWCRGERSSSCPEESQSGLGGLPAGPPKRWPPLSLLLL